MLDAAIGIGALFGATKVTEWYLETGKGLWPSTNGVASCSSDYRHNPQRGGGAFA